MKNRIPNYFDVVDFMSSHWYTVMEIAHKVYLFVGEMTMALKTYSEILSEYGSDRAIVRAVASGALHRVGRGLYADEPYAKLVCIAAKRYPASIVSMESAFYYQNLTDVVPDRLHLSSARNTTKIRDPRICQHFVPLGMLEVGVTTIERGGCSIRTYDLERICIDLVRSRNKLPYELYKEVVLSLRGRSQEMYPAKIDDYLDAFPYRDRIMDRIEKEIF